MRALVLGTVTVLLATSVLADTRVIHSFSAATERGNARRVIIDIPAGDVTVRNGAGDRIVVTGHAERRAEGGRSRDAQQRLVDEAEIALVRSADGITLQRHFGPHADNWRKKFTTYSVTVEVPAALSVDVRTYAGDVRLDGDFGDVDVDLRAGDINVTMPRAAVRELNASCRIGDVVADFGDRTLRREGVFAGTAHFQNATGHSVVNVHATAGDVRVTLR
jgi:hypothetical protein